MAIGPIIPYLWFEKGCREAARFYIDAFPDSRITHEGHVASAAVGIACDMVEFELGGQPFAALDGGPMFTPKPSVSFIVNFDPAAGRTADDLDALWAKLTEEGEVRMPLDKYPFAERFGWVADKYGFDWQLMLTDPDGDPRPFVVPAMMFSDDREGLADEAIEHYVAAFSGKRGITVPWAEGEGKGLMFADYQIGGTWLAATDDPYEHNVDFQQAISWLVECDTQEEMDALSDALSAEPDAERCGWVNDRYRMPWQVTPRRLQEMLRAGTPEQIAAVVEAFHPMKRLDLATLEAAFQEAA
ncbi:MAG: VOC family protein [Thermoplasmatota archaeon]